MEVSRATNFCCRKRSISSRLIATLGDTDPQGSLAAWWNSREAPTPLFAAVDIARLPAHLQSLEPHQVQLVVIDTPPALTDTIQAAIGVADLVLIPARPSPHDLRAIGAIVAMAEQAGIPFCFVVNGATPRTTIAIEALRRCGPWRSMARWRP